MLLMSVLFWKSSHIGIEHCHNNVKVTEEEVEKVVEEQNSKAASATIKASDTVTSRRQSLSSNLVITGGLVCQYSLSDVFYVNLGVLLV